MNEMGNQNNQAPVEPQQAPMQQAPMQQAPMGLLPNAPGVIGALVCGILSLTACGPILGIVAIILGNNAKKVIKNQPGVYGGLGLAQAGFIMGLVSVAIGVLIIAIYVILILVAVIAGAAQS